MHGKRTRERERDQKETQKKTHIHQLYGHAHKKHGHNRMEQQHDTAKWHSHIAQPHEAATWHTREHVHIKHTKPEQRRRHIHRHTYTSARENETNGKTHVCQRYGQEHTRHMTGKGSGTRKSYKADTSKHKYTHPNKRNAQNIQQREK